MIQISETDDGSDISLVFTENEDRLFSDMHLVSVEPNRYRKDSSVWDCFGDVIINLHLASVTNETKDIAVKHLIVRVLNESSIKAEFYAPESLIKLVTQLDDWNIMIKKYK